MNLSPTKCEILETMLFYDRPLRPIHIAKGIGKEFPSVMMHIIGLTRLGYTTSTEKGYYTITERGKRVIGIPTIDREKALTVLAQRPYGESFHFYASEGKPLEIHANSLRDFCMKMLAVDLESIRFHLQHGDFEAWFAGLGDVELAKKTALLKEKKMIGQELRMRLRQIVENRSKTLARIVEPEAVSA
jgi:hypothetical protein